MDENLPADADPSEWTWQALANWANARFDLNLKDKDLKKYARSDGDEFQFGHQDLEEFLNEKANASLEQFDLVAGARVPSARLGTPLARAAGSITSSPWPSIRRTGPISIGPRSCAASRRCPATSTPRRRPSCRRGSP